MRGVRPFLVLLVLAAGLGAYIYFVESKRTPASEETEKREKVFSVEAAGIQALEVKSDTGERTKLKKADGAWQIVEPAVSAADDTEASGIATGLASLEIQRVVEEKPADIGQYGLKDPRIELAFQADGATGTKRLLIGQKTPTGGDLYAKLDGQDRVFLIPAYLETTFNRGTFDLRDKRILKIERDKIETIEIVSGDRTLRLAKAGADWTIAAPVQARGEYSLIDGIVGRLDDARMSAIVATEKADLKSYGLDKPKVLIRLGMGSSQAAIEFGKTLDDNDKVYARDVSRPIVFTVQKSLPEDLGARTAADYRRKDLFEFRPFTAARIEFARDDKTYTFEKVKGQDGAEKWRQTAPAQRDPDATKMESLLSAFANLRAQSFVDAPKGTGLDKPVVVVSVEFGDSEHKEREKVSFGQAGDAAHALAEGEPGAAKLDATEFTNALKALDEIIK